MNYRETLPYPVTVSTGWEYWRYGPGTQWDCGEFHSGRGGAPTPADFTLDYFRQRKCHGAAYTITEEVDWIDIGL